MNKKNKTQTIENIKTRLEPIIDKVLDDLYMQAWHQGRHEYRKKLVDSDFIRINPERKLEVVTIAKTDQCICCEYHNPYLMLGCSKDITLCKQKQKQNLCLELLKWFE